MTPLSIERHPVPDPGAAVSSRLRWHSSVNLLVVGWLTVAVVAAVAALTGAAPGWLPIHALLLGAATSAIVIWTEHFAVAVTHARQPGRRGAAIRLTALTVGQVTTVAAAVTSQPVPLAIGATTVGLAIAAHAATLLRLRRGALGGRLTGIVDYYLAASVAMLAGAVLGGLMGAGVSPHLHERMHLAHEHLVVAGWLLLTIVGTMFMLLPSAARVRIDSWTTPAMRWCLRLAGPGLAVAVLGMLMAWRPATTIGLTAYAAGLAVAAAPLARALRRTRPVSGSAWLLSAATAWLLVAAVVDVVLSVTERTADFLGPIVLIGGVGQVLLGSLTYLLPVVLGAGPEGARRATALLDAYWPLRVAALNTGVVLIALAAAGAQPAFARAGWTLIGLTVAETLARMLLLLVTRLAAVGRLRSSGPALAGAGLGVIVTAAAVLFALSGRSAPQATVVAAGPAGIVDVALQDMRIVPGTISVPAGTHLILRVTNHDNQSHDLRTAHVRTPMLRPHATADLDLGTITKPVDAWCTVPGHRAAGMRLAIVIGPAADQAAGFTARNPALAPADPATVHRVELPIVETQQEIAPGVRQTVWTFGGTVPGPTLRGHVGDLFEITLINQGSMGHGIDFHAGAVAPDAVMRTIEPGERLTYRFRADRAGIWLYHCSTMPMSQHIAAGMFGAVVIDPPGLPAVDREYLLVSSEIYGDASAESTLSAIKAGTPDHWAFNGAAGQYDTRPLTATAGQRVRFWLLNAGPGSTSAFHVVGAQFDTVYAEGGYRLRRGVDPFGQTAGGAQVLDLAPAQGGFVETVFVEPGTYALVDHDMRHAETGAHGKIVITP
ncbi:multicopper oxidase domain-containing protein [Hamadaea sp. NPDC050747]|uniref:multicopper oxidase domain-containing protein n=1 Tax=Hamadaea sp. NPDC050747 TaxID=3155789 RepID=UPI0033CF1C39